MNAYGWNFDNSYARLPHTFFDQQNPVPVRDAQILLFNTGLAERLGLDAQNLNTPDGARILAGNVIPAGATPLAQAYAGHQFGYFTMLGDGRALLLGEHVTPDGKRFDIQLKGAGQTMFSRSGDGRAAIGPMLREYIISEAMHALGIPTSRSLAVVTTGEHVYRETRLQGAILTRVAASHIRVGTFQYLTAQEDWQGLALLAAYTLRRHFPERDGTTNPARALLEAVIERQAALIAKWMLVGFVHGVMNTDNMAVSGETIDYGPCAFMDTYNPATVFSSIDHGGRYAYGNQPNIAQWNLARFAEVLLPMLDRDTDAARTLAEGLIEGFYDLYKTEWLKGMRAKLGIFTTEDGDENLARELLDMMQATGADYTATLRSLSGAVPDGRVAADPRFALWHDRWQQRRARQEQTAEEARDLMNRSNPAVIPRNHKVEEALLAAETGDLRPTNDLLAALSAPYVETAANAPYRDAPAPSGTPYRTFCGT